MKTRSDVYVQSVQSIFRDLQCLSFSVYLSLLFSVRWCGGADQHIPDHAPDQVTRITHPPGGTEKTHQVKSFYWVLKSDFI